MLKDITLKLPMRRTPRSDHSWSAEKTFDATLYVEHLGSPDDQRWLELRFATNPDGKNGSYFETAIYPRNFAVVAQMMMLADPQAAIRAFGKAMENAEIQRRDEQAGSEETAA